MASKPDKRKSNLYMPELLIRFSSQLSGFRQGHSLIDNVVEEGGGETKKVKRALLVVREELLQMLTAVQTALNKIEGK